MRVLNGKYDYYEHQYINNLLELLNLGKEKYGNRVAFSFYEDKDLIRKTYEEVYNDVLILSTYFMKHYKNKNIALIGENCYNWIITFLGIVISGNVCVVLDKDFDNLKVKELLKKTDTKVIYYSKHYCPFIKDLKIASYPFDNILDYREGSINNSIKINDDKEAVIFFTSGTTGDNKAVMLSQKNIATDIYGASSLFKPVGNKTVSVLPFHHAFGLITSALKPFYYGVEVFINSSLKYVLNDFKEIKPETLFVVPAFIEMFYKQIWKKARNKKKDKVLKHSIMMSNGLLKIGIDMRKNFFKDILDSFGGNLKYIICGGAFLDKKYIKWFRSIGIIILNGYGITECSPVVAVNRNMHFKDGSVGQLCRGIEAKIIDNEICIKGPIVMKGYYKDKKATDKVLINDYFYTGDLGYIDNEGFLFITGRKKNIIILSNGENISPEAIENDLSKDKGVSEVLVYSEANKINAYIYPNEEYLGDQEYFDDLIYNYNRNKPKNRQLALVKLRKTPFIKNNNGKILRDKMMEEEII